MKNQQKSPLLFVYFWVFVLFLYLPIVLLIIFSFNDANLLVFPLKGFTLRWYQDLLAASELQQAAWNSLILGLISSLISTILGTAAAISLVRYNFPGKRLFLSIAALPLVIPYVVLGVALLILFDQVGIPLSLWTVGAAHIVINMPFVMLVVAARLAGFDSALEEAAMDLGANYWMALGRVTLPIAAPALLAAFLMSFTTSFDEFALAFFLTGNETTLPVYLYSQLRFPYRLPLVITLASVIMVFSIALVIFSEWLRQLGESPRKVHLEKELLTSNE